ncbi:MAG TPA: hypothetical protein VLK84_15390 [Longimicrobium sp.]|nr:hypothetical protein [Longimicrobium sp.]
MTDGFDAAVTAGRQGWGVDDPRSSRDPERGPASCSQPDTVAGADRRMLGA